MNREKQTPNPNALHGLRQPGKDRMPEKTGLDIEAIPLGAAALCERHNFGLHRLPVRCKRTTNGGA